MRDLRSGSARANLLALVGSGVATVLVTRGYLAATGYPKIGGGGLHIAHVLGAACSWSSRWGSP